MGLLVQKFGGSSIRDAAHIRAAAEMIQRTLREGHQVVVTVSAMGNETDELLDLAPRVSTVRPGREMDMLVTSGERKAAALVSMALEELGIPTKGLSGEQAGISTDGAHTEATIVDIRPGRIRDALNGGYVPVVTGAQGMSDAQDVTFLGRGGSDTTAVALAAALGADACELYTDVHGIYTANPRLVPEARLLSHLSFDQMVEMCCAGCPKPATRAVELARDRGVTLHIRAAQSREPGTWIERGGPGDERSTRAVVDDRAQVTLRLSGVRDPRRAAARLAEVFAAEDLRCDPLVRSQARSVDGEVSFAVASACLAAVRDTIASLHDELGPFRSGVDTDTAKVSVIGPFIGEDHALRDRLGDALAAEGIAAELLLATGMRLSWVVGADHAERAVRALHRAEYPEPEGERGGSENPDEEEFALGGEARGN